MNLEKTGCGMKTISNFMAIFIYAVPNALKYSGCASDVMNTSLQQEKTERSTGCQNKWLNQVHVVKSFRINVHTMMKLTTKFELVE